MAYAKYRKLCDIGRCVQAASYKCPSCGNAVCEDHTGPHMCVICFQAYLDSKPEETVDVEF